MMTSDPDKPIIDFWKKQFSSEVTTRQTLFDVLFGVIAPCLCIIFDPFVFRYEAFIRSPLIAYRIFAYVGMTLGIMGLISWLIFRSRIGSNGAGFFAGILLFGALFAAVGGLALLPFSLLGILVAGIGLLGFIPFFTGFVFWRNGLRALRHKEEGVRLGSKSKLFWGCLVLGLVIIVATPAFAQWQTSRVVSQGVRLALDGDEAVSARGVEILKEAFWCDDWCYRNIVIAYSGEKDEARRVTLSKVYEELTGRDIETLLWIMND